MVRTFRGSKNPSPLINKVGIMYFSSTLGKINLVNKPSKLLKIRRILIFITFEFFNCYIIKVEIRI